MLRIICTIHWGENYEQLSPKVENYPNFGEISADQIRKILVAPKLKLNIDSGFDILNIGGGIFSEKRYSCCHFTTNGTLYKTVNAPFKIAETEERNLIDFVLDKQFNLYLLEQLKLNPDKYINQISKIDSTGRLIWSNSGDFSSVELDFSILKGKFTKLILDDQHNVYITSYIDGSSIALINPVNGTIAQHIPLFPGTRNALAINFGNSIFSEQLTNSDSENRLNSIAPPKDKFGILSFLFGVDKDYNGYALYKKEVVKFSFEGDVLHSSNFEGVLIRPEDKTLFKYFSTRGNIIVEEYLPDGSARKREFTPTNTPAPIDYANYKLIHIDMQNRNYIHSGEEPGKPGNYYMLSKNGEFIREISRQEAGELQSHLSNFTQWKVTANGEIIMAVAKKEGLYLLEMKIN